MIRFIFYLALFIYLLYLAKRVFFPSRGGKGFSSPPHGGEEMVKDPVCNIYIPVSEALKERIGGEEHHFCSRECAEAFKSKIKEGRE